MNALQKLVQQGARTVAGFMSGTSLDGVDVAVVRIVRNERIQLATVAFESIPYSDHLRERLLRNSANESAKLEEITRLNLDLARTYASALEDVCDAAEISTASIDLIGSHGQTICHLPRAGKHSSTATLQIGDPSALANLTGIPVVGDFRVADVALGGQGAPLVPYFDYVMFNDSDRTRIALNIGGIANITVLRAGGSIADVIAFDTGPGNMVMDILARRLLGEPYDNGGSVASSGAPHQETIDTVLGESFFQKRPPKSTGREAFGHEFVDRFVGILHQAGIDSTQDVMATAAALTVQSVRLGVDHAVSSDVQVDDVIVGGGGVRNDHVMNGLEEAFNQSRVATTADFGIDPDAKEAICFAVLANETIDGNPSNVPSATGASARTVLGKICLPPPDHQQ
ncbi:MAG: anhydro-N-acetylmuramic acid kinase [Rhodothermales bacterium]|nr:anhydro-N-acetylmuramic acid kinase [Rhodothermales bacterium]